MSLFTTRITLVVSTLGLALAIVAAMWTNVRAQDQVLFSVGTCWRVLGVQSVGGPQFKVLEVAGPWLRTTDATASNGSTWINSQQLPGVQQALGSNCQ